jgi:hypothetical protein
MVADKSSRELAADELERVSGGHPAVLMLAGGLATNAIYDAIKGRERLPVDQWIDYIQRNSG